VECHYKVLLDIKWHFSDSGLYLGAFALTAETALERQPDGTLKNSEDFNFTFVGAGISDCSADFSRLVVPTSITGQDLVRGDTRYKEPGHSLELDFKFGAATEQASFKCPDAVVNPASSMDAAKFIGVVPTFFPPEGGTKTYPMPGEGQGEFTVTVTPDRSTAQK
jgi:hypothetical protein